MKIRVCICLHCGDTVQFSDKRMGAAVRYPYCTDKPECREAKALAKRERDRQSVKRTYAKHGGAGKYKAKFVDQTDEYVLPKKGPAPKCVTSGCKNRAHREYDGIVEFRHCRKCLQRINRRAKVIEASWFPETQLYY